LITCRGVSLPHLYPPPPKGRGRTKEGEELSSNPLFFRERRTKRFEIII